MLFLEKIPLQYRDAFAYKVQQMASLLGVPSNWLMVVMNFETAGTFSPSIQNKHTQATGLIQFMPATAIDLGTNIDELKAMNVLEQLEFVEKYLVRTQKHRGDFRHIVDLYLAVFYPASINKDLDYIYPDRVYAVNKGFDLDGDGKISKAEIQERILRDVPPTFATELKKKRWATGQ